MVTWDVYLTIFGGCGHGTLCSDYLFPILTEYRLSCITSDMQGLFGASLS